MKKILLLNPPAGKTVLRDKYCSSSSKANYFWPPIDLLVQSGILHNKYHLRVIDAVAERMGFEKALGVAAGFHPNVVIFLTGSATWKQDIDFIRQLKAKTSARTIGIGGNILTQGADIMAKYDCIDAILLDFSSQETINFIENENNAAFKNMIIRQGNKSMSGSLSSRIGQGGGIFEYPVPRHELFPLKKYAFPLAKKFPFANIITDFGCPFNCRFCICEVLSYKTRKIKNILEELDYVKSLCIPELFITDFSFGVNKQHAADLCQEMLRKNYGFSWSCQSRVDIDKETLKLMKEAGCHTIQFGVESGSQDILDLYAKGITKKQVIDTFRFCRSLGIRTSGYFIFGLLGETEPDLRATLDFALELDPDFAAFSIAMPREGTSLSKNAHEAGLLKDAMIETDTTCYSLFESGSLPASVIWNYRNEALRRFYFRPRYFLRRINGIRSFYDLQNNFAQAWALCKNIIDKPLKKE